MNDTPALSEKNGNSIAFPPEGIDSDSDPDPDTGTAGVKRPNDEAVI